MIKKSFNFTKKDLDSLSIPTQKMVAYSDTKEPKLKLYITNTGKKTFFLRTSINGRDERIIIGSYPDLTITQAREKARELKGNIASGQNPAEEKRKINQDITIAQFFRIYIEKHSKNNKTSKSIQSEISLFNNELKNTIGYKKMLNLTKSNIEALFKNIVSAGKMATANRTLSLISGMYNRAIEWGYQGINPAKGIKKVKEKSRKRFIMPDELSRFFNTLDIIGQAYPLFKNYILMSLYTGQRRGNILSMRWDEIDLNLGIWFIPMTKNGESLNYPLTDEAKNLLYEMKKSRTSKWVFPSNLSLSGHYEEPKRLWRQLLNMANIEDLRIHDLRRTLGSYQAINGSSLQIIGQSLGHKSLQSTQVYARLMNAPILKSTNEALQLMNKYINNVGK